MADIDLLTIIEPFVLFPGSSVPIVWSIIDGSTVDTTQTPVTDATGTLTILDPEGNTVPGATNISFVQTPLNSGTYIAMIDGTQFNPPVGIGYISVIVLTSVTKGIATWKIPTEIQDRDSP